MQTPQEHYDEEDSWMLGAFLLICAISTASFFIAFSIYALWKSLYIEV